MTTLARCTACGHDCKTVHINGALKLCRHDLWGCPTWQWRRACLGSERSAVYVDIGRVEIKTKLGEAA